MRYRQLSPDGDYEFGRGVSEFLANSPATVAQAVQTRLLLVTGEWFLNLEEGTPYPTQVLGKGTEALYDQVFQERILETPGVTTIQEYQSILDENRTLTVRATINTIYGATPIAVVLPQGL